MLRYSFTNACLKEETFWEIFLSFLNQVLAPQKKVIHKFRNQFGEYFTVIIAPFAHLILNRKVVLFCSETPNPLALELWHVILCLVGPHLLLKQAIIFWKYFGFYDDGLQYSNIFIFPAKSYKSKCIYFLSAK